MDIKTGAARRITYRLDEMNLEQDGSREVRNRPENHKTLSCLTTGSFQSHNIYLEERVSVYVQGVTTNLTRLSNHS